MPYSASSPRRLATSAQVHPKFLPYIHAPKPFLRGPAARRYVLSLSHATSLVPACTLANLYFPLAPRLPAYAAAACIGYAIVTYQAAKEADSAPANRDSHLSEDRMALLDAYGGRDSLEELEMAARVYESQRGQGHR
jgi:hypothetical protein